tara:strand:+ start:351 stop:1700 length:1350 start_codon:yes stop_codon:yes gene_type:complete
MPKKKFGPDDIFYNTVKTYPQTTLKYYFNQSYINNRQTDGNRVQSGSVSLFELNVDRVQGSDLIKPFIIKGENFNDFVFNNVTATMGTSEYSNLPVGTEITGNYPFTSSVSRERLIGNGSAPFNGFDIVDGVSDVNSVRKLIALENAINYSKIRSPKFDFDEYYVSGQVNPQVANSSIKDSISPQQKYMSMFLFPEIFKAQRINPGSLELNFYITGTLIGTAKDTKRNGELVETYGPRTGGVVGTVLYEEGVLLLTGNYDLDSSVSDGYLCPVTGTTTTAAGPGKVALQSAWKDAPKWAHFGAYQSFITNSLDPNSGSYGPVSSSYEMIFEGTNTIPTLTMFAHADKNEFNWSNNLTYVNRNYATGSTYQEMVVAATGSAAYLEKEYLPVKNTISSSFANYSASYQDQTFITKVNIYDKNDILIGTAKLAKPVTKTNSTDYTFKLKIDL